MDKRECVGCEDNFYNGNNPQGIKDCWHLKDAKLVAKFKIGVGVPWTSSKNFLKVRVPNCYTQEGYAFIGELPEHLRREA